MTLKTRILPPAMLLTCCSTLLLGAPSAWAGSWSNPVYNVTNRAPAQAGYDHAPTGGGGSVGGPNSEFAGVDPSGASASGTVTATFTWVPEQGKTAAQDPPPSKAYVLQTASAMWAPGELGGGGLGPGGLRPAGRGAKADPTPTSSPSSLTSQWPPEDAIDAEFETQANGSASDGLGDPETPADPAGGTSSGKKLFVKSNPGTTFTTDAISLAAACNDTNSTTSWNYRAEIIDLGITSNGVDITDPKPAYQAQAGQNTALAFSGAEGNAVANPSWTLPQKCVKDWIHNDVVSAVIPLDNADLASASIPHVFWVSGDDKTVTFNATVYGTPVTLTGKIHVTRPTYDFSVVPQGTIQLLVDGTNGAATLSYGIGSYTTNVGAGILFNVPNKPVPNNILTIVHKIVSTNRWIKDKDDVRHTWAPTSGLDMFPMFGSDTPNQGVFATDKEIYMSDSFDAWLMYNPTTGGTEHEDWIYVPLKKLSWNWTAHAIRRGANGWVATTTVDSTNTNSDLINATPAQAAVGTDTLVYPDWVEKASPPEGHFNPARTP